MTTWRERIQAARERGAFTEDDRLLAQSWLTCAVGEQIENGMPISVTWIETVSKRLPARDGRLPCPDDGPLRSTGYAFYEAISDDDFDLAEKWLERVEDRALALKREFRDQNGVSPEPSDGGGPS